MDHRNNAPAEMSVPSQTKTVSKTILPTMTDTEAIKKI